MEFEDQRPHLHSKVEKIRNWVHLHRPLTLALIGLVLILLASATAYGIWVITTPKATGPVSVIIKPKPKYYSPLTGELVKTESATQKPVTAIMIENSPDARPQSGLKDALSIVEKLPKSLGKLLRASRFSLDSYLQQKRKLGRVPKPCHRLSY